MRRFIKSNMVSGHFHSNSRGLTARNNLEHFTQNGQIVPYFQPLVNLRTGSLSGFEILARWQHPIEGLLPPSRFIPAIERSGRISDLTDQLLASAARYASAWRGKFTLSLNISPSELHDRSLPQRLVEAAEANGFSPERLIVEITEGALIEDIGVAGSIIDNLKALGIRVALDDLGTGYSSLHHLQTLPFDEVKIDSCFIRQITKHSESRKIAAAMIGLGLSLGLTTVAEGIEEQEQADILRCFGCSLGQGWLFGPPISGEDVPEDPVTFQISSGDCFDSAGETMLKTATKPWESLAELRAIYEGAPFGLCFLNCDCRVIKFNRQFANLYPSVLFEAHAGRKLSEVAPGLALALDGHIERAILGKGTSGITMRVRESTTAIALLLSCQPVRDESGDVIGISVAVFDASSKRRIKS